MDKGIIIDRLKEIGFDYFNITFNKYNIVINAYRNERVPREYFIGINYSEQKERKFTLFLIFYENLEGNRELKHSTKKEDFEPMFTEIIDLYLKERGITDAIGN